MTTPITPEMIAAWKLLKEWAYAGHPPDVMVVEAINTLDNSDWMVPIEEAEETIVSIPLKDFNGPNLARALRKAKERHAEG